MGSRIEISGLDLMGSHQVQDISPSPRPRCRHQLNLSYSPPHTDARHILTELKILLFTFISGSCGNKADDISHSFLSLQIEANIYFIMMICSLSHLLKVRCLVICWNKSCTSGISRSRSSSRSSKEGGGCCQKLKIHSENLPNCPVWDSLSWRKEKINILWS